MNNNKDELVYTIKFEETAQSNSLISENSSIHKNISPYSIGDLSMKEDNIGYKLVDLLISGNIGYRFPKEFIPVVNEYMDPKKMTSNNSLLSGGKNG